jgi:ParB/Sulfiredoxin domain
MSDDLFGDLGPGGDPSGLLANPMPRKVELSSLLIEDKTFQFRLSTPERSLEESMRVAGSLNPIKIMPHHDGEGYIILDGHCRVAAATLLGWKEIWAFMYPMLSDPQARWVSYVSNTGRKNLTIVDRANFALMARKRGDDDKTIEQVTQRKTRTIQRYLRVSPDLLEHFDGSVVNLCHLQCIQDVDSEIVVENLGLMIETIREDGLDSKAFKKWLWAQGWLKKPSGRKRDPVCAVWEDRIKFRLMTIARGGKKEVLNAALESLTKAAAQIQGWLNSDSETAGLNGTIQQPGQDAPLEDSSEGQSRGK